MSDVLELKAEVRERVGKGAARAIRRDGRVPGVIYGDKQAPEAITLNYRDVEKQHQTGNFLSTVYNVDVGGEKNQVIPKDVQLDPVRDSILHVDFLRLAKGAVGKASEQHQLCFDFQSFSKAIVGITIIENQGVNYARFW